MIGTTYPHYTDRGTARYGQYPATVTFMYAFYGVLSLTSLSNAEIAIRDLKIRPSSSIDSAGQIISLVIAIATGFRAAWLFYFLFKHDESGAHGLVWPFELGRPVSEGGTTYISAEPYLHGPKDIQLGNILRDPQDLTSRYRESSSCNLTGLRETELPYEVDEGMTTYKKIFFWFAYSTRQSFAMRTSNMREERFDPSERDLSDCAKIRELQKDLGVGSKQATVFLVVSVQIATDLSVVRETHRHNYNIFTIFNPSHPEPTDHLQPRTAREEAAEASRAALEPKCVPRWGDFDLGSALDPFRKKKPDDYWQSTDVSGRHKIWYEGERIYSYEVMELTADKNGRVKRVVGPRAVSKTIPFIRPAWATR